MMILMDVSWLLAGDPPPMACVLLFVSIGLNVNLGEASFEGTDVRLLIIIAC